jgi:hypothetical protein
MLTVIIPCKDEEANIRGCVHSARKVADEIIIADSGSTDRTLEIVGGMEDVRVVYREYINSGNFKNWAIPQAAHRWVLILDADERITDALAGEIKGLMRKGPAEDGYWIYRASFFMGHRVRFSGWQNDRVLRLFRRDLGRYQGESDHAEVSINSGRVGRLKQRMLHYSYWTYRDYLQRMQRYSTYQASQWQEQGRAISRLKLYFNLPLRFLQLFVLRLGFLDGLVGFQVCLLTSVYSFSKQACLWQLACGRSPSDVNRDFPDIQVREEAAPYQRFDLSELTAARQEAPRLTDPRTPNTGGPDQSQPSSSTGYVLHAFRLRHVPGPVGRGAGTLFVQRLGAAGAPLRVVDERSSSGGPSRR